MNYFYLPTGDTVTRDSRRGRGIFGGGNPGTANNTMQYIDSIARQCVRFWRFNCGKIFIHLVVRLVVYLVEMPTLMVTLWTA